MGVPGKEELETALREARRMREQGDDPQHLALLERMDMPLAYLNSADYAASLPATLEEQRLVVRDLGLRM